MYVEQTSGYWGNVTSSVDWCELNYEQSYYVVEWFNTISSLALIFVGEFGAYYNYSTNWKQRCSFHMLSIIGLGSLLFHMTLKYETQMLDELPMVWASALVLIIALETKYGQLDNSIKYSVGLITVIGSIFTAFATGPYQIAVFRLSFLVMELGSVILGVSNSMSIPAGLPYRRMAFYGLGFMAIAGIVWVIDNDYCKDLRNLSFNPQLHGFWHIFMALGIYQVILFTIILHQINTRQGSPHLNYFGNCIPYISKRTAKS